MRTLLLTVIVVFGLEACAASQKTGVDESVQTGNVHSAILAYERYRTVHGPSSTELAKVAGLVLEEETLVGGARRQSAVTQLTLAGTAAKPVLERLSSRNEPKAMAAKAEALRLLSNLGDEDASKALRVFVQSKNGEVKAAAIGALDPDDDVDTLIAATNDPEGMVREAAVRRLGNSQIAPKVLGALTDAARRDPLNAVRSAAMASLKAYGIRAEKAVLTGLSDPHPPVRLVAMATGAASNDPKMLGLIRPYIQKPPDEESLEAARLLALHDSGPWAKKGKEFLLSAMGSQDVTVRHQSLVALGTLKLDDNDLKRMAQAMAKESEVPLKVAFAEVLAKSSAYKKELLPMLEELSKGQDLPAVHASLLLAKLGQNEVASKRLAELMNGASVEARAVAARGLARDLGMADEARAALQAPHPRVRIEAAGGILVAATKNES